MYVLIAQVEMTKKNKNEQKLNLLTDLILRNLKITKNRRSHGRSVAFVSEYKYFMKNKKWIHCLYV